MQNASGDESDNSDDDGDDDDDTNDDEDDTLTGDLVVGRGDDDDDESCEDGGDYEAIEVDDESDHDVEFTDNNKAVCQSPSGQHHYLVHSVGR